MALPWVPSARVMGWTRDPAAPQAPGVATHGPLRPPTNGAVMPALLEQQQRGAHDMVRTEPDEAKESGQAL